jgi:HEAT repeat protein
MPLTRSVRLLLVEQRLEAAAEQAVHSRRGLDRLVALTYDADPEIAWRAVEVTGMAAARIAEEDAAFVREHLRRLHWTLREESGAVGWRAPETLAEIVRRRPELFADYVPIVVNLLVELAPEDLFHFRSGVLWAIGRLGGLAAGQLGDVLPAIVSALDDPVAQVRGMAAWALGEVGQGACLAGRVDLRDDRGAVERYTEGRLEETTVGRMVREALAARPTGPSATS